MKKPKVTYSTTAYVECRELYREIIKELPSCFADGPENYCSTVEDIADTVDDTNCAFEDNPKVRAFLKAVLKEVSGKAGDVIFHR